MTTPANNNTWGRALTEGAPTQTSDQVAAELLHALDKKYSSYVAGGQNRMAIRLAALIPNAAIARTFANRKRKSIKA